MLSLLELAIFKVVSSNLFRSLFVLSIIVFSLLLFSCFKIDCSTSSLDMKSIGALFALIAFNNTFSSSLLMLCDNCRKQISLFNCDTFSFSQVKVVFPSKINCIGGITAIPSERLFCSRDFIMLSLFPYTGIILIPDILISAFPIILKMIYYITISIIFKYIIFSIINLIKVL